MKKETIKPLSQEEAVKIYEGATQLIISQGFSYKDRTEKAFLYILKRLEIMKKDYEKNSGSVTPQEVVKNIEYFIKEVERQFDIVDKGWLSHQFDFDLTIDKIKNRELPFDGFNRFGNGLI